MDSANFYEFLQISPNAEPETIQRVYRFLAGRYHPDNPETGDTDKFLFLKHAFEVLSDPHLRAKYDASMNETGEDVPPMSASIDFMDGTKGELNRRCALLALLYIQRRTNPYSPAVSLAEVELRMGFPRDYLNFTIWYLSSKKYLTKADNYDLTLTALGVDFVEASHADLPILSRLLSSGDSSEKRTVVKTTDTLH